MPRYYERVRQNVELPLKEQKLYIFIIKSLNYIFSVFFRKRIHFLGIIVMWTLKATKAIFA